MVRLSPLESAIGTAFGLHGPEPPLPDVHPDLDPITALERAILPGLLRPPCVVAFSGGRDSSAVLAVATRVARREGLQQPVPLTQFFPEYPETDESHWQELVVGHLGLREWSRHECGSELSMLGPGGQHVIRRYGVLAPVGAQHVLPILSEARPGTVLTGVDGDGLFNGGSFARLRAVLGARTLPRPRDLLTLSKLASPPALRRARDERQTTYAVPWLQPDAEESLRRMVARESSCEPLRWRERVRWWARLRYLVLQRQTFEMLARDGDVLPLQPLLDPTFLAAVAQQRAFGYGSRTDMMRTLFGDLLPASVLAREDKAHFTRVFWSGEARAFIDRWTGTGLQPEIVDAELLSREWSKEVPDARSGLLLQAAWAAASGVSDRKQPFNCSFR